MDAFVKENKLRRWLDRNAEHWQFALSSITVQQQETFIKITRKKRRKRKFNRKLSLFDNETFASTCLLFSEKKRHFCGSNLHDYIFTYCFSLFGVFCFAKVSVPALNCFPRPECRNSGSGVWGFRGESEGTHTKDENEDEKKTATSRYYLNDNACHFFDLFSHPKEKFLWVCFPPTHSSPLPNKRKNSCKSFIDSTVRPLHVSHIRKLLHSLRFWTRDGDLYAWGAVWALETQSHFRYRLIFFSFRMIKL